MAEDKMELWKIVCKTDPDTTKRVNTRGGFTAIDAQSQVKRATEMFGSFGFGWGTKDETFTQPITGVIIYQATLYYNFGKEKGEFPIHSSIVLAINNRVDDDAIKKVATDALTKGLSKLGFNSDVFEGKFDDNKYVNQMENTFKRKASQQQKDDVTVLMEDGLIANEDIKKMKQWLKTNNSPEDYDKAIKSLRKKKKDAIAEMNVDPKD